MDFEVTTRDVTPADYKLQAQIWILIISIYMNRTQTGRGGGSKQDGVYDLPLHSPTVSFVSKTVYFRPVWSTPTNQSARHRLSSPRLFERTFAFIAELKPLMQPSLGDIFAQCPCPNHSSYTPSPNPAISLTNYTEIYKPYTLRDLPIIYRQAYHKYLYYVHCHAMQTVIHIVMFCLFVIHVRHVNIVNGNTMELPW